MPTDWRERAVDRSLRNHRERAIQKTSRFIDAATELLTETGRTDFTVQDIVDRSGQSVRAFYQHFAGKDDLLLAVFEQAMETFANELRRQTEKSEDPLEQLRLYVETFHRSVERGASSGGRALSVYHLQLAQDRPAEFASAIAPQMMLLEEIVDAAVAAGELRRDVGAKVLVLLITQALMSVAQLHVLGLHAGARLSRRDLWGWVHAAVTPPALL
ncbi:MAG: TetR/AcrR family transcriptional regulator [Actinobacteria bacterium]|nr:TetR/AcrR family transcriptional regulator [Actinomycetota bacterium]MBV9665201.1 TetR/AcrR family transcriptional regulator [Actinomycetota bacterium]